MKTITSYISHHLLPVTTIFFVAGIWLVPFLSPLFPPETSFLISLCLLLILSAVLYMWGKLGASTFLLPICCLFIGYLHGHTHMQPPSSKQHIYNLIKTKTEVVLTGHLSEMVTYDGKMSRAVIALDSVRKKEDTLHTPAHGKVRLSYHGKWPQDILPGDYIVIRSIIKRPRSYYTPGAFDYEQFLAQQSIWVTGFISSPLFIKKLSDSDSFYLRITHIAERLRTHIGNYLDQTLSRDFASMYRALLIGDRSGVSSEILELFKATGVFHILAISGLHVAVFATFIYLILYWVFSRSELILLRFNVRKIVASLTIPLLLGYALLAGMNSPVMRAVIMSSIVILALCTDRVKSPAPLVAAAALIILIIQPQQIFTASFQLSFAATIGILFILPNLHQLFVADLHKEQKRSPLQTAKLYIFSGVLVSIVATLATAPITLSTFNRISTIGPLANLIIEPIICLWCLPVGVLALPFIWLSPTTADLLLQFGTVGISFALKITRLFTEIPHSSIYLPDPSIFHTAVFVLILYGFANGLLYKTKKIALLGLLTLICITGLAFTGWSPNKQHNTIISFLDVGQGSATIIETDDHTILIDGGGSSFSSRTVGESVIAPFLWNKGIKRVDTIIITHPDADHYNGLSYIIEKFSPKTIWVRDLEGHDNAYRQLLAYAKASGAKLLIPESGEILHMDGIELKCIANLKSQNFKTSRSSKAANSGLVIKLCVKDTCILFPGDINSSMENYLLNENANVSADILLSAHHGSMTSNSTQFLEEMGPQYTIVSAGVSSKGYFPHKSFLKRCKLLGIRVLNTSIDGTVEIVINDDGTRIRRTQKHKENPLFPFSMDDITAKINEHKP